MPSPCAIGRSGRLGIWCAWSLLVAWAVRVQADDAPPPTPPNWPDPAQLGRPMGGIAGTLETPRAEPEAAEPELEAGAGGREKAGPLDPFFDLIDPARLQRKLDQALGPRYGHADREPTRPEVPEIGEPVFFDLTRPLGAKRYSNEINYLYNSSTRNGPTLQIIEYEYAFADWKAAEFDLQYFNGSLEILTPFYQRTLGVGRRGRSVYGVQLSPDIYLRSGFVGGTAVFAYGYQPTKESKFSLLSFVGANRALIGGFQVPTARQGRTSPMLTTSPTRTSGTGDDRVYGAWRPNFNLDLFYQISDSVTLSYENDFFFQSNRGSEYFSFPYVTWVAGQHAFFQVGGGYYHFESRDQFTFLVHLNFVNPSVRREEGGIYGGGDPESSSEPGAEANPDDSPRPGRIRRWLTGRRSQ